MSHSCQAFECTGDDRCINANPQGYREMAEKLAYNWTDELDLKEKIERAFLQVAAEARKDALEEVGCLYESHCGANTVIKCFVCHALSQAPDKGGK